MTTNIVLIPQNYLNVLSYNGVDPTGATDSTTGIQNAINDTIATRTNGSAFGAQGGGLFFPRGLYVISSPLVLNWPITIAAAGWGSEIILKANSNCDMIQFNPQASDWFNGAKISNLKLNNNGANQTAASSAINAKGAVWCEFDHIWFNQPYTNGLYIHDDNLGGFGHHNYIHHNLFVDGTLSTGTGSAGCGLYTHNSDENRITDNIFQNCGSNGSNVNNAQCGDDSGLQTYLGNVFVAGATLNIKALRLASTRYTISGGNIFDGGTSGQIACLSGASNATITGNYFYQPSNTSPCIALVSGTGYTINDNVFESNSSANASDCAVDASALAANAVNIGPNNQVVTVGTWNSGVFKSANTYYQQSGAPSNSLGNNGDYYLRTDTPGTANQRIYVKSAGAWSGIV